MHSGGSLQNALGETTKGMSALMCRGIGVVRSQNKHRDFEARSICDFRRCATTTPNREHTWISTRDSPVLFFWSPRPHSRLSHRQQKHQSGIVSLQESNMEQSPLISPLFRRELHCFTSLVTPESGPPSGPETGAKNVSPQCVGTFFWPQNRGHDMDPKLGPPEQGKTKTTKRTVDQVQHIC